MINKIIDIEDLELPDKKKEFSSKLETNEKQHVIDIIKSYARHHSYFDSFKPKELESITNVLAIQYLFKKFPGEDKFKCFIENIKANFGTGPSMSREQIDTIDFLEAAVNGAPYGGLIGAIGSGIIFAIGGATILQAAAYSLLGAFIGGAYNGYSNKTLKLNANFDEAVSRCFGPHIEDVTYSGKVGEVTEDGFYDL